MAEFITHCQCTSCCQQPIRGELFLCTQVWSQAGQAAGQDVPVWPNRNILSAALSCCESLIPTTWLPTYNNIMLTGYTYLCMCMVDPCVLTIKSCVYHSVCSLVISPTVWLICVIQSMHIVVYEMSIKFSWILCKFSVIGDLLLVAESNCASRTTLYASRNTLTKPLNEY
jgi:hypothetical protein